MTSDPAIIEAAAREILVAVTKEYSGSDLAAAIAVLLRIKAAALERAAQRIEANDEDYMMRNEVAAAIRALKEQP